MHTAHSPMILVLTEMRRRVRENAYDYIADESAISRFKNDLMKQTMAVGLDCGSFNLVWDIAYLGDIGFEFDGILDTFEAVFS